MSGHISPKSVYYGIFSALMVLTIVTIAVAFVNLGAWNFPVALAIAITKASLVVLFFMHVKYSSRLTKMIVGMAFFFLLTLFGLTMTDYLSRGWFTTPRGSTGAGTSVTIRGGDARDISARPEREGAAEAEAAPEH